MNDIDILEEYLDKQDRKYVSEYRLMILNAIETLISENKELKEMLKHRIEYTNKLEKDLFQNASNYVIPKSKVVEELRKAINNEIDTSKAMFEGDFTNGYIYALQSLLGKE